jgi:hypothetical protein
MPPGPEREEFEQYIVGILRQFRLMMLGEGREMERLDWFIDKFLKTAFDGDEDAIAGAWRTIDGSNDRPN